MPVAALLAAKSIADRKKKTTTKNNIRMMVRLQNGLCFVCGLFVCEHKSECKQQRGQKAHLKSIKPRCDGNAVQRSIARHCILI